MSPCHGKGRQVHLEEASWAISLPKGSLSKDALKSQLPDGTASQVDDNKSAFSPGQSKGMAPEHKRLGARLGFKEVPGAKYREDSRARLRSESASISQEQLVRKVKSMYAGLVMFEEKCIEVAGRHTKTGICSEVDKSTATRNAALSSDPAAAVSATLNYRDILSGMDGLFKKALSDWKRRLGKDTELKHTSSLTTSEFGLVYKHAAAQAPGAIESSQDVRKLVPSERIGTFSVAAVDMHSNVDKIQKSFRTGTEVKRSRLRQRTLKKEDARVASVTTLLPLIFLLGIAAGNQAFVTQELRRGFFGAIASLSGYALLGYQGDPRVERILHDSMFAVWGITLVFFLFLQTYSILPEKQGWYIMTFLISSAVFIGIVAPTAGSIPEGISTYGPLFTVISAIFTYYAFEKRKPQLRMGRQDSENARDGVPLHERPRNSHAPATGQAQSARNEPERRVDS
ncbi:MAG: hypothetical protein M1816_005200 [Peltula sp. TS41687]|nr:MAG: hypothetical protein M1816_005200 [Peltula sp. TS41687]